MGTAQVEFTEDELLSDLAVSEPLLAGGVRCHGGFDADGHLRLAPHPVPLARPSRPGASRTASASPPS